MHQAPTLICGRAVQLAEQCLGLRFFDCNGLRRSARVLDLQGTRKSIPQTQGAPHYERQVTRAPLPPWGTRARVMGAIHYSQFTSVPSIVVQFHLRKIFYVDLCGFT